NHTDALMSTKKIAQKARKMGFGVAITDHNDIRGALEMSQYEDVFSIPGIEVGGSEGIHTLVYFKTYQDLQHFYRNHIEPHRSSKSFHILDVPTMQIIRAAARYDALISAAHPFGPGAMGIAKPMHGELADQAILEGLDAVEVINGAIFPRQNTKAAHFAQIASLGITGGSDGHTMREIGKTLTVADADSPADFLDAIRYNRSTVIGKENHLLLKPHTKICTVRDWGRNPLRYGRFAGSMLKKKISYHISAKNQNQSE
ncbi:MAG: PHP domain-containing protein, partial [Nanoarchaeota archaeon]